MASIFTGLAFMHGHIVDRELVLRLGREEKRQAPESPATEPRPARAVIRDEGKTRPVRGACATC
jgi:hypothetical protein